MANIFLYNHQGKEIVDSSDVATQILVLYPLGYLSCLSCFITVMLSTTRALALAKPFYNIKKRFVSLAFGICAVVLITLFAIKSIYYYILMKHDKNALQTLRYIGLLEMVLISVTVLVVGVNSGISIKSLRSSNESLNESSRNDNSRKASTMILTLSIVFVICNGTWSIMWLSLAIFGTPNGINTVIGLFLNVTVVSMNSTINPIVYMIKNSALNSHLRQCWMNLRR